ncbi:D-amino acid dehydrogenase small subunit [Marinomonas primoryensis]|jgi:D-amino-acid dehydrogenase|uniref:D-amino acid dehydrogenase small subunit n=1 Tax=Marinomonas primoryensis TaxID=178399 RepID=A0A2Z4PWT3_9GAMM|nr:D-amino acid dehydrogenase [Marinomonas primoryensis]AWY01943.1 D-amino acid dehydrogenase small subunit [Marinomonas primoryensis]|tara:strand:+ start:770 stop:2026 length:1257 start_codon:yes stop_codon:yes gene_type:complete
MKICVLGAGVVGLTTAYYLVKKGFQVTVIDRQPGVALETSFANAGQISPGYSAPWAAPGIPLKAIKWLMQKHAPLRVSAEPEIKKISWMVKMLGQCNNDAYSVNKSRMMALAEYSRDQFISLRKDIGIQYQDGQGGTLQLFRKEEQVDAAEKDIKVLKALGVPHEVLTPEQIAQVEPGLRSVIDKFKGGLRLTGDETGDCYLFCQSLKETCEEIGVTFQFNSDIKSLSTQANKLNGVITEQGLQAFDSVVVCLGSYSKELLKACDIDIPVYPVKGYSLTVPILDTAYAPISTVMDETYKVAVTRLGDRIRAAGTAELTGYNLDLPKSRTETISHVVNDLFGKGCDLSEAEYWTGLRPMTPDGTPVVGASGIDGLYLNTGHGTLGWTMSCGSAAVIADIIAGDETQINSQDLSVKRYKK